MFVYIHYSTVCGRAEIHTTVLLSLVTLKFFLSPVVVLFFVAVLKWLIFLNSGVLLLFISALMPDSQSSFKFLGRVKLKGLTLPATDCRSDLQLKGGFSAVLFYLFFYYLSKKEVPTNSLLYVLPHFALSLHHPVPDPYCLSFCTPLLCSLSASLPSSPCLFFCFSSLLFLTPVSEYRPSSPFSLCLGRW